LSVGKESPGGVVWASKS